MTAMPQMVALFNGVGGGAVALIAWVEFRSHRRLRRRRRPTSRSSRCSRRSSARSRSGARTSRSASCRRSCPGARSRSAAPQQAVNALLLVGAVACARGDRRRLDRRAPDDRPARVRRRCSALFVVLPIGGADMPVVISLLNAFTGLSAAATGVALNNTALIVAGMIVGASGSILTNLMAAGDEPLDPGDHRRRLRRRRDDRRRRGRRRRRAHRALDQSAADAAIQMTYANRVVDRARLRHGRRPGPARGARDDQAARGQGDRGLVRDPPGRRAHAGPHERAAGRGRRALRAAHGDGRRQQRVRRAPTSPSSSAPTTSPTPTRARRPTARSTGCRSSTSTSRPR